MKEKKGVSFAIGIIIIIFIVTISAFYSASLVRIHRTYGFSSLHNLTDVQAKGREIYLSSQESVKFASHQALYSLLSNPPTEGECSRLSGGELFFEEDCVLSDKEIIKEHFLNELSANLDPSYSFRFSLEGQELRADANEEVSLISNFSNYTINPSFSLTLPLSPNDINSLYEDSKSAIDSCKEKEEEQIIECITSSLNSDNFEINIEKENNFLIFHTESKQRLFFNDGLGMKFERVTFDYTFSLD